MNDAYIFVLTRNTNTFEQTQYFDEISNIYEAQIYASVRVCETGCVSACVYLLYGIW